LQETKWLACEAGQLSPCSAKGVNAWSYTSSPHCMSQRHDQGQLYFHLYYQSLLFKCITKPVYSHSYIFKKLEILLVPCQYVLSLLLFIIDNSNNFQTSLETHKLHARSKNRLFIPVANLTSVQKGMTYSGIKIYNRLPNSILNHWNDRKKI
jgi:hypothetical protein